MSPHRCLAALVACTFAILPAARLAAQETAPAPAAEPQALVIAVDGSGLLRELGPDLQQAVRSAGLACRVETFNWSHGAGRVIRDYFNRTNHQSRGRELAGRIAGHREAHPGQPIFIVAHSSGAAVVMAAATTLPDGCVDRIILLAPAVATGRDMSHVLRCSRTGVDAFYNPGDLLSQAQTLIGTPDGGVFSAGGVGFVEPTQGAGRLRQHPWDVGMAASGHFGGHFGWTRAGFLGAYVVPLLRDPDAGPAPFEPGARPMTDVLPPSRLAIAPGE